METILKEFDDRAQNPWRSPLVLKLCIIFMMTQYTTHVIGDWSGVNPWGALTATGEKVFYLSLYAKTVQICSSQNSVTVLNKYCLNYFCSLWLSITSL